MRVGLLIITHGDTGAVILQAAMEILGVCPLDASTLCVTHESNPETVLQQAQDTADRLDEGHGILVLTDLYGSTPCNIACQLADAHPTSVVTGVNLPMLVRVLNYPQLDLGALTSKAVSGGIDGVFACKVTEARHA